MEIKEYRLFSPDVKEILMFKWFKRDNGKNSCRHDFFGFCKLFTFFGSHVFFFWIRAIFSTKEIGTFLKVCSVPSKTFYIPRETFCEQNIAYLSSPITLFCKYVCRKYSSLAEDFLSIFE